MDTPPELADEMEAINAIYGPDTLRPHTSSPSPSSLCLLAPPPSHPLHPVTLLVSFPASYPDAAPSVIGPHSVGPSASKGAGASAASAFASALAAAVSEAPGEVCMYAALEASATAEAELAGPAQHTASAEPAGLAESMHATSAEAAGPAFVPRWTVTPPTEVHKSVFVGRACAVRGASDVAAATAALGEDKRVARATHNMRAWRLRSHGHQESDDDGESGAGARVLAVAAGMDAWDVLVVVSRWYGGVKLGPERFRVIGRVAREALVLGGWDVAETKDGDRDKGKKR